MNRKHFLQLMGAGTLGLTAWTPSPLAGNGASSRPNGRELGVWLGGDFGRPASWPAQIARMREAGVTMLIANADHIDPEVLVPVAAAEGMKVHAWMVVMPRQNFLETHPHLYAVNRNGVSTAVDPPYVPHYRFLCPNREEVQEWQVMRARELARIEGLTSVHLDYIRFPDVILPVTLWPKYNVIQDRELPEFDYCYCEVCRSLFREQTGHDPMNLPDPASDQAWVEFRWDSITNLVSMIYDAVHDEGKQLTAAVFPTPDIARRLVRQDWPNWKIDGLMPMMYHSFYDRPISWIGDATREGVEAVDGRIPIYSGVYMPALTPGQLADATRLALDNGSKGVVLFHGNLPTERHWNLVAREMNR